MSSYTCANISVTCKIEMVEWVKKYVHLWFLTDISKLSSIRMLSVYIPKSTYKTVCFPTQPHPLSGVVFANVRVQIESQSSFNLHISHYKGNWAFFKYIYEQLTAQF